MSTEVHNSSTYVNHGCRCEVCTQANAEAQRNHRARRLARRFPAVFDSVTRLVHPDAEHGTQSAYCNYGCRCPECTDAHRDSERRRSAS